MLMHFTGMVQKYYLTTWWPNTKYKIQHMIIKQPGRQVGIVPIYLTTIYERCQLIDLELRIIKEGRQKSLELWIIRQKGKELPSFLAHL